MHSNGIEKIDKLKIDIVKRNDGALACLFGLVDIDSSPAFRNRLLALLEDPQARVVSIDFSGVTHIDTSGVATLIEALKIARAHKVEFRLQGLHDELLRFLEITGTLSLFAGSGRTVTHSGSKAV